MPPRAKMIRISLPVEKLQTATRGLHEHSAERAKFLANPAEYLSQLGINVPAELVDRTLVSKLMTERHDPGSVAIAV